MTKSLKKDFGREIKKSISRFISILLIVVLGVAFYSGIRSSMPAMQMTADAVYDKEHFMDIRVVGTLGLTENDLNAVKEIEGVETVEGAFTQDYLCLANSNEIVTKVLAMPKTINDVKVSEGRYPEKYNECVASKEFLEESGYKIGDTLTLSTGTDDDIFDTLADDEYTIVGLGSTSYFLNGDMGTSTIGDGMVDGYIVIPSEAFVTDIYTSLYISVAGARELDSYSDDYNELVDTVINKIEAISGNRCDIRYSEVRSQSTEMLEDAKNDFTAAEVKAKNELAEAYQTLLENEKLFEENKAQFEKKVELLSNAEANLPLYRQQIADGEAQLAKGERELKNMKATQAENAAKLEEAKTQYEVYINDPSKTPEQIQNAHDSLLLVQSVYDLMEKRITQGEQELEDARKQLDEGKSTLADLESAVANKQALIDAQDELVKAENDIKLGREKYEIAREDAMAELADAEADLNEAEREINSMEVPVWYVLNRDANESFMSFKNDTQSIGAIGTVFPIIFFLVAALVALTTMTRMVEEQRTQIGTLKALGYSKFSIIGKYLLYAGLASVIGSILGVALGEFTIPYFVVSAYKTSYYNLGNTVVELQIGHAVAASVTAIICTTGASFLACYKELTAAPAQLMRPEAPKVGKRTWIERIDFIWERLNFGQKAAMRNLFRYKKRFFMTLFGVGGCMALLLVGLGIRDSVSAMVSNQYGDVFKYDGVVSIDSTLTRSGRRAMLLDIGDISDITEYAQANRTMVYAYGESMDDEKNAYMVVPRDVDGFEEYVHIEERGSILEDMTLSDEGVIITEKYANLLDVSVGDSIFIRKSESDSSPKEVKVAGISENYIFNYIYMTPTLYQSLYNTSDDVNVLLIKMADGANIEDVSSRLLKINGVNSVTMNEGEIEELNTVINSLYFIVVLMIVAAAVLAFVVLYNLNNINISERRRELATLKLLGFYDKEMSAYVYRENIVLTILGTILGIFIGIVLHRFVMVTVETDVYMFGRELHPLSILIGAVLTILFSVAVNVFMYFKLKKIDMIESLKSVE